MERGHSFVVVIPTYNRPEALERCLEHALREAPAESVFVVDSSPDRGSEPVVDRHPGVTYLYNPDGIGHLSGSRRIGMEATDSDVIVFLDDDVLIRPGYLATIVDQYADRRVGAVGGRLSHGQPGEELDTGEPVGRFHPDTSLSGGFTIDTSEPVKVDHLMGATMTYRRAALEQAGGIRDIFPGTCLREDSDLSLRVARSGWRLLYEPSAVADHIPAAYARGARFDVRYTYYGARNHLVLMTSVFGIGSPQFRAAVRLVSRSMVLGRLGSAMGGPRRGTAGRLRHLASSIRHAIAAAGGGLAGLVASARWALDHRTHS